MKRFIVIAVVLFIAVAALKHHRAERRASRALQQPQWSLPDRPLPPRSFDEDDRDDRASSFRFASARGRVQITADTDEGVQILVKTDGDCAADATAAPPTAAPAASAKIITSDLMYTEQRARLDLNEKVVQAVSNWLADADIPHEWQPPQRLVQTVRLAPPQIHAQAKEYAEHGQMYQASVPVDLSERRLEPFLQEYRRHVAGQRLGIMGAGLVFILTCLGIGVGYVRTDDATKGYYTNRLRLLAAAGVGAAAVLLYQWVVRFH